MSSAAAERGGGVTPGPRPVGLTGIALGSVLLTLWFVFLGFPYDRLGQRLARALGAATATHVSFRDLGPVLSVAGPGIEATGVELTTAGGVRVSLERVRLRPAWSLAWLRLDPAIHIDLEGPSGRVVGVVRLGGAPGFRGELEGIELERLPLDAVWPGVVAKGTLDASIDLRASPSGPEGSASLIGRDGNLGVADYPMAIPFQELTGSLRFGGGHLVELQSLEVTSPLFSAKATGHVAQAKSFADAPLALQVEIEADPSLRSTLHSAGIRTTRDGHATVRIRGTPSAPVVR